MISARNEKYTSDCRSNDFVLKTPRNLDGAVPCPYLLIIRRLKPIIKVMKAQPMG